jgi:hypothetical protein
LYKYPRGPKQTEIKTFDNKKPEPFCLAVCEQNPESDHYPFALVISFMGLQKRRLHPLPIGALTPFKVFLD